MQQVRDSARKHATVTPAATIMYPWLRPVQLHGFSSWDDGRCWYTTLDLTIVVSSVPPSVSPTTAYQIGRVHNSSHNRNWDSNAVDAMYDILWIHISVRARQFTSRLLSHVHGTWS